MELQRKGFTHMPRKTRPTKRFLLWVFVNSLLDNPVFDSQTKETLTTRQSSFGSKCNLPESILKDVSNSGIVAWADFKNSKDLKKTDGTKTQRVRGIIKLEDANDAGGKNSDKCTLILTEGDSAKELLQLLGCLLWVETIMVSFL